MGSTSQRGHQTPDIYVGDDAYLSELQRGRNGLELFTSAPKSETPLSEQVLVNTMRSIFGESTNWPDWFRDIIEEHERINAEPQGPITIIGTADDEQRMGECAKAADGYRWWWRFTQPQPWVNWQHRLRPWDELDQPTGCTIGAICHGAEPDRPEAVATKREPVKYVIDECAYYGPEWDRYWNADGPTHGSIYDAAHHAGSRSLPGKK